MTAFYSEFDPKAAAWLRELIKQGHIADGVVDERDLWDVSPDDLRGFDQVHLCAGIGVWSYALRRAGWPDDRPVWTGSFPCQPFSAAGKGAGFADERHLWPAGQWLIEQCRPAVVFGEQVASKDAEPWIDLVQADLEALGYSVGAIPFPSAGVGAPHIRDRLYWVADAASAGTRRGRLYGPGEGDAPHGQRPSNKPLRDGVDGLLADASGSRLPLGSIADDGRRAIRLEGPTAAQGELSGGLADADGGHAGAERQQRGGEQRQQPQDGGTGGVADAQRQRADRRSEDQAGSTDPRPIGERQLLSATRAAGRTDDPGPVSGLWRDADWLFCRDGKWRPVEPGTFPLAHGAPARVGRLRGYGNAINAEAAVAWIESYLDAEAELADRRRVRLGVFA